jgi:hypothetical protein
MGGLFDMEKSAVKSALMAERQLMAASAGIALGGFILLGLLTSKIDRLQKLIFLLPVNVAAWSLTAACASQKKKEGFYRAMDTAQELQLKSHLQGMEAFYSATSKMERQNAVVKWVLKNTPQWQWERREHEFGLQGLFPRMEQPAIAQAEVINSEILVGQQPRLGDVEAKTEFDYSWLDTDFIKTSKAVLGARGSGKTTYLNYEAMRFLQLFPDGWLLIGDLHFDEDEVKWLPGIPSSVLMERYVATKAPKILEIFRSLRVELLDRIEKRDRKRRRIKFICDEFIGFMGRLNDAEKKEVLGFLATCQDEGRKFGVDVTLGLHSIKKERSGIDSSILFQMDVLCLKNSISDPATKFPSDWDTKNLSQERHLLQSILKPGQGFACVVCKQGEAPCVQVLPSIDLNQFSLVLEDGERTPNEQSDRFDTPNRSLGKTEEQEIELSDQWYQNLQFWAISLLREPTHQELAQKFLELTGYELVSEGLQELLGEVQQWRRGVKE